MTALILLLAYLLGSIPFGLLVGKIGYGIDIREHGSGNLGGTNTFRVLGAKAGTIVIVGDMLKGTLAASLPMRFFRPRASAFGRGDRRGRPYVSGVRQVPRRQGGGDIGRGDAVLFAVVLFVAHRRVSCRLGCFTLRLPVIDGRGAVCGRVHRLFH